MFSWSSYWTGFWQPNSLIEWNCAVPIWWVPHWMMLPTPRSWNPSFLADSFLLIVLVPRFIPGTILLLLSVCLWLIAFLFLGIILRQYYLLSWFSCPPVLDDSQICLQPWLLSWVSDSISKNLLHWCPWLLSGHLKIIMFKRELLIFLFQANTRNSNFGGVCVWSLFIAPSPIFLPEPKPRESAHIPLSVHLPTFNFQVPLTEFLKASLKFSKFRLLPEWWKNLLTGPASGSAAPKSSLHSTSRVVHPKSILALFLHDISFPLPAE